MKKIYKLSFIALFTALLFNSCAVDDDAAVVSNIKDLTASLNDDGVFVLPAATTTYDLIINFSETLTDLASVEYSIDGVSTSTQVSSGANSLTIPINITEDYHKIEFTDFNMINSSALNYNTSIGANSLILLDGQIAIFNLTWSGTSDLDCEILDSFSNTLDGSYSTTQIETVSISDTDVDDIYEFIIDPWTITDASIDYQVEAITTSGIETFSGQLNNAVATDNYSILSIDKTTNTTTGDITYTITEL